MIKKRLNYIIITLVAVCIGILSVRFMDFKKPALNKEIKDNREYLKNLESQNIKEIEKKVDFNKEVKTDGYSIENSKKFYQNTLFLGDSITEYLSQTDLVNAENVLAKKGETVFKAKIHLEEIKNFNPKNVVLVYGMNDVEAYSVQKYKRYYEDFVKKLKEQNNGVNIIIQSPFNVINEKAKKYNKIVNNKNLNEFKKAAKEVAEKYDCKFSEIDTLSNFDYFEPDGIHFKYGFYKDFLKSLSQFIR